MMVTTRFHQFKRIFMMYEETSETYIIEIDDQINLFFDKNNVNLLHMSACNDGTLIAVSTLDYKLNYSINELIPHGVINLKTFASSDDDYEKKLREKYDL